MCPPDCWTNPEDLREAEGGPVSLVNRAYSCVVENGSEIKLFRSPPGVMPQCNRIGCERANIHSLSGAGSDIPRVCAALISVRKRICRTSMVSVARGALHSRPGIDCIDGQVKRFSRFSYLGGIDEARRIPGSPTKKRPVSILHASARARGKSNLKATDESADRLTNLGAKGLGRRPKSEASRESKLSGTTAGHAGKRRLHEPIAAGRCSAFFGCRNGHPWSAICRKKFPPRSLGGQGI